MRSINRILRLLAAAVVLLPAASYGQGSSLNTFSPYSFYGMGNLFTQGSASVLAMGGAGVAVKEYTTINILNPASYSAIHRQSALLSLGLGGQNYYLKDENTKSSFNSFNIRDLAFQIPLSRGLGAALSVTPYSAVGYRVSKGFVDPSVGHIEKSFSGEGGVNQFKLGLGWETENGRFAIGAEAAYYHGTISRSYNVYIEPFLTTGTNINMYGSDTEKISTVLANVGTQVVLLNKPERRLVLGAVYKMGGAINSDVTQYIPFSSSVSTTVDTIRLRTYTSDTAMPHVISVGLNYARTKFQASADYTYSTWGDVNEGVVLDDKAYFRNTHTVSGGVEWIPNIMDVRNYFNRCSYRFGLRYSEYNMVINGHKLDDKTITLGVGFPLEARRRNSIDVAVELGRMGTLQVIQQNYFKFSIGFRLFGSDYWFQKYKYN